MLRFSSIVALLVGLALGSFSVTALAQDAGPEEEDDDTAAPPPAEKDNGATLAGPPAPGDGATAPDAAASEGDQPLRLVLAECIERALRNSYQIAAERHRLAALEAKVEQAFWAQFANFSVEGFFSVVPDKCVDEEWLEQTGAARACSGGISAEEDYATKDWGPTFHVRVQGGVPVYTFGKISSAREALAEARAAKEANLPSFRSQVRLKVEQAYHAIVGAREMLYTISVGRKHLVKARKKVERDLENEEGTATQVDLLKLQVFEAEVDALEIQSRQIERVALAALRFLVGGADSRRVDVPEDPQTRSERELESLERYRELAIDRRPELKALKHAIKAMEAKVELRRSEFYPDVLIIGSFRYAYTPGRTKLGNWALKDNWNYGPNWAVGLALRYDLDWGLDVYKLDEAKAELAALSTDQKQAFEGVMLEVEKTFVEVESTRDALLTLEKSKRLVKGWMAAVVQGHAAGLNSAKEVKDALKEYFTVMATIHRLTAEYNAGLAALDRVTGHVEAAE